MTHIDEVHAAWTRNEIRAIAREEIRKHDDEWVQRMEQAFEQEYGVSVAQATQPKPVKKNWLRRFFKEFLR